MTTTPTAVGEKDDGVSVSQSGSALHGAPSGSEPSAAKGERDRFEDWAVADSREVHPLEDEERTPENGLYYAVDSTNHAYIGWRARADLAKAAGQ